MEAQVTCHCLACRKISGSTNVYGLAVPAANLRFTAGAPKGHRAVQESGLDIDVRFCGDCGSALAKAVDDPAAGPVYIVFAGTLDPDDADDDDDAHRRLLAQFKPQAELFVKHRVPWLPEIPGTAQCREFE